MPFNLLVDDSIPSRPTSQIKDLTTNLVNPEKLNVPNLYQQFFLQLL